MKKSTPPRKIISASKRHPLDAAFRNSISPRINTQQNAAMTPGVAQMMKDYKRG